MRGVDPGKNPETKNFRLPAWVFIIIFRWLYKHNESMQRCTAHAADSVLEAKENYKAALKTANELGYDMPNFKALGVYL